MSLIAGEGVAKYYGAHEVFRNLAFRIEAGDRIGLVGANGEGKTTLLRLLAGLEECSAGGIHRRRALRLGYLPQDPPDMGEATVWQTLLAVFAGLRRLEAQLEALARQLEAPDCGREMLERYSALQAEFERREGYLYEKRLESVLTGLGFGAGDFEMPVAQLSGGQRTRVLLGRLLLEKPDLLLLDEPTNHLDLRAVEWLERWVQDFEGSMVVVSHDRYFLDKLTNRTWEIAFGGLERYRGRYSAYARQRLERYERRLKEWEAQQEYIEKTREFIRRYIAGQRTREAQGRRTRLERFLEREAIHRPREHPRIRVRLQMSRRSGDIALRFSGVAVGYEAGRPLLRLPEIELRRGWRVALVGPNGAGKTTLVRTILGELELLEGEIRPGAGIDVGYLAQAHDELQGEMSVLEAVRQANPGLPTAQLRTMLGSFLFSGDEVFQRLDELSGGQRSRVALARLVVQRANLLLLDEPTNHLDIASQEVLERVLDEYEGTLLLVSHDRYLIQALATHIWSIEEGKLRCFEGGWEEYLCRHRAEAPPRREKAKRAKADRRAQREAQKQVRSRRKQGEKIQQRHRDVEERIHRLEERMQGLSRQIGRAGEARDMEQVHTLAEKYQHLEESAKTLWKEWEKLVEALEKQGGGSP